MHRTHWHPLPCRSWTHWLEEEHFVTWTKWMLSMGLILLLHLELSLCALSPALVLASTGCHADARESLLPKWALEQLQLSWRSEPKLSRVSDIQRGLGRSAEVQMEMWSVWRYKETVKKWCFICEPRNGTCQTKVRIMSDLKWVVFCFALYRA